MNGQMSKNSKMMLMIGTAFVIIVVVFVFCNRSELFTVLQEQSDGLRAGMTAPITCNTLSQEIRQSLSDQMMGDDSFALSSTCQDDKDTNNYNGKSCVDFGSSTKIISACAQNAPNGLASDLLPDPSGSCPSSDDTAIVQNLVDDIAWLPSWMMIGMSSGNGNRKFSTWDLRPNCPPPKCDPNIGPWNNSTAGMFYHKSLEGGICGCDGEIPSMYTCGCPGNKCCSDNPSLCPNYVAPAPLQNISGQSPSVAPSSA